LFCCFFFSSRRRHTRFKCDWSSDVCSSDLRLAQQGISTLLVSHRMGEIRALADVCTVLRDGRSVLDRVALSDISDEAIVEAMGQKSSAVSPPAPRGAPAASARMQIVLRSPGVSLSVASGEVLGLAGAPAGPSGVIETLIGA